MNTGIYKIINILNNDFYIGSAALSFERRWRCHKANLKRNKHHSIHLQRAWNKYNEENFIFKIIEYCKPDECLKREQYYIDNLIPHYNINRIAGSNRGRKFSIESRQKMSEQRKGRKTWNKGKPFSKETCEKMSKSRLLGIKRGTVTFWNKGKKHPKNKPILREDGKIYKNIPEAAKDLNVKENTIVKACTDKKQIRRVRKFILKYM